MSQLKIDMGQIKNTVPTFNISSSEGYQKVLKLAIDIINSHNIFVCKYLLTNRIAASGF
jgi:hypothetical protein